MFTLGSATGCIFAAAQATSSVQHVRQYVHVFLPTRAMQQQQSQRLPELDAAKFLAMLSMIIGHTLDALVLPEQLDVSRPPWSLWNWWRGITAPVFLTISGILFTLTLRRNERGQVDPAVLRRRTLRALQLAAIGYLLVFPAHRLYDLPFVSDELWRQFFQVNVLQLVAVSLAMLVIAAVLIPDAQRFRQAMLIGGSAIALATPLVHQVAWYDHLPAALAAYLSYDGGSIFPVFPFAAFMLLGAWFGGQLASAPDRQALLRRRTLQIGMPLLALGAAVGLVLPLDQVDLYRHTPAGVAIREGVVLLLIAAASYLLPLVRRIRSLLTLFGKYALTIYVVHLLLLFGTPWFSSIARLYPKALDLEVGMVVAAAVVVLTLGSIVAFEKLRAYVMQPATVRVMRIVLSILLAYLLLV